MKINKYIRVTLLSMMVVVVGLAIKTYSELLPFSELSAARKNIQTLQVTDRNGIALSVSYQNKWNSYDYLPLHQIPTSLQRAFILSEDQHFYEHEGIDWKARAVALWEAIRYQKARRGASTLSEQVVRMLHPRPRTLWSKWIETFEVAQLEAQFSKPEILEFYLNEVPYASNRRGVLQAARFYFDRDLGTLSIKETLALVVLARAPSRYDLRKDASGIDASILRLATRMRDLGLLDENVLAQVKDEKLALNAVSEPVNASHFVSFVRNQTSSATQNATQKIHTTLDANLQRSIQGLLDQRVKSLAKKGVHNAGAMVVDHETGEIVAWVVAGANRDPKVLLVPSDQIDTVTTPRQPRSLPKPFLYALALESGWTAATIIEDSPLADMIGEGYHPFHNYSHTYYGNVTLRQALGNSLNIPALRTIKHTGVAPYFQKLQALGFKSLKQSYDFYDEGLALGNGEVSLFEMVQAYTALAHHGEYRPLKYRMGDTAPVAKRQVYGDEASSLIAHILSDPKARQLEFGSSSILNLPTQTAVKTGTSSDYHDAWVVGFNHRYVVGIWMGNLDRTPMQGVTGALGPSLTLRSIFAELTRHQDTQPLYLSPRLVKADICIDAKIDPCETYSEYFINAPLENRNKAEVPVSYEIALPTPEMQIAIDPRVAMDLQKLPLQLNSIQPGDRVHWIVDGQLVGETQAKQLLWPLRLGKHTCKAIVHHRDQTQTDLAQVAFAVK